MREICFSSTEEKICFFEDFVDDRVSIEEFDLFILIKKYYENNLMKRKYENEWMNEWMKEN